MTLRRVDYRRGIADALYGVLLICVIVVAGVLVYQRTHRQASPPVDTKLATGEHITFVLVGPTSGPSKQLGAAVESLKVFTREEAAAKALYFSTVGVSDHWSPSVGASMLSEFGAFDELVLGRNWLNSGVVRYINALGGTAAVPQVVVVRQWVRVDTLPMQYGEPRVLARLVGEATIEGAKAGGRARVRQWLDDSQTVSTLTEGGRR